MLRRILFILLAALVVTSCSDGLDPVERSEVNRNNAQERAAISADNAHNEQAETARVERELAWQQIDTARQQEQAAQQEEQAAEAQESAWNSVAKAAEKQAAYWAAMRWNAIVQFWGGLAITGLIWLIAGPVFLAVFWLFGKIAWRWFKRRTKGISLPSIPGSRLSSTSDRSQEG